MSGSILKPPAKKSPEKPLIMGVDPGLTGAIAFYNYHEQRLDSVYDMPVFVPSKGKKSEIDTYRLAEIVDLKARFTELAVIEEVSARPKQGAVGIFRFGYVTGLVTGVVAANYLPCYRVPPAVWKSVLNLTKDKKDSLNLAAKVFGDKAPLFSRTKDDGRAEAALLAQFGERFICLQT